MGLPVPAGRQPPLITRLGLAEGSYDVRDLLAPGSKRAPLDVRAGAGRISVELEPLGSAVLAIGRRIEAGEGA